MRDAKKEAELIKEQIALLIFRPVLLGKVIRGELPRSIIFFADTAEEIAEYLSVTALRGQFGEL